MLERKPEKEFAESLKEQFGENTDEVVSSLQRGIPAISLPAHSAVVTAYLNDVKPEYLYAQLTYGYGKKEDLLIGLSTSGNSGNVVNAVKVAKAMGIKTASITGAKDSKLSSLCDTCIKVPETETYKVQELHLPVYHAICAEVESILFG
jgi:D-sedoheptulose 7-phosphate isomerase